MWLFSFFKLLFQKWNICSFSLSCFRFLSITSFSQRVASSGNVSGCKLTSSVKITLLLVMLDASGLSLWYYCCIIHSFHVGLLNTDDIQASSFSLLMLSGLVPPSVTVLVFGRRILGCPCLTRRHSLELAWALQLYHLHRTWFVSLYILQLFLILLRIHAIPCNISAIVTKANILVTWFKL